MPKRPIVEIEDMQEPFCGIRRKKCVPLIDAEPEIAREWLYSENCGWGPEHLSRASGVRCWWECSVCKRAYKARVCSRTSTNKSGCPYCASKRVCEENSFAVLFPQVAKEWHPTKNEKLSSNDVMYASNKRAWWLCSKCNYEWECGIGDRTVLESGCPACYESRTEYARKNPKRNETPQVVLNSSLAPSRDWYKKPSNSSFVSLYDFSKTLARQWHPTKNGSIKPYEIAKGSDAIVWWKCSKGPDHKWQAAVYSRTMRKSGCPFCGNKRLSVTNCLANKSPALAKEFHPTKNGKITPKQVIAGGRNHFWWQCRKNKEHEWETDIYQRLQGSKCPYCTHRRVSNLNCLSREFPYIAAQLHPTKNNGITGNEVAVRSAKKLWWKCPKGPDHEWEATPANRTAQGSGCPFCAGKKVSITTCLATLAPEIAAQWDKVRNRNLTPLNVTPGSNLSVWWQCDKGHTWRQRVVRRVKAEVPCIACKRTGRDY